MTTPALLQGVKSGVAFRLPFFRRITGIPSARDGEWTAEVVHLGARRREPGEELPSAGTGQLASRPARRCLQQAALIEDPPHHHRIGMALLSTDDHACLDWRPAARSDCS